MQARIIDGTAIATDVRSTLERVVAEMSAQGTTPGLATVLVGEDPASLSYVRGKQRMCERLGLNAIDVKLPHDTPFGDLEAEIAKLNRRDDVHGILIQQPLPDHLDAEGLVAAVDPAKDVDGFHPVNLGRLLRAQPCFVPCTPLGILVMLRSAGIATAGADVVIVGRSLLVGRPLASLLVQKSASGNATVTVCHSATPELARHTRRADILVAAIGSPGFVGADMVKEGAVVIDVGINRVEDAGRKRGYRLVGDVDYEPVSEKVAAITPVPGGVGPMTVAMLMHNTVQAARGVFSQDPLPGEE
jgi:methylenetetrahydrofolate dehydrogenase (NADP+)/methenyltetrahydrofolate cyclohydrolase